MNPKDVANRFFKELINQKKMDKFDEIFADNFHSHSFPPPNGSDRSQFKDAMNMIFNAFDNMQVHIEHQASDGNKVYTYGHWTGKHKGEFMGVPASNKDVKVDFSDVWRVESGKLAENWVVMDIMALMGQIGGLPAK